MTGFCFHNSAFPISALCVWNSLAVPNQASVSNILSSLLESNRRDARLSQWLACFPPARTIQQPHWTKSAQQTQPIAAVIYCHFYLLSQRNANSSEWWKHWRFRNNFYEVMPGNTLTGQDSSLKYLLKQKSLADKTGLSCWARRRGKPVIVSNRKVTNMPLGKPIVFMAWKAMKGCHLNCGQKQCTTGHLSTSVVTSSWVWRVPGLGFLFLCTVFICIPSNRNFSCLPPWYGSLFQLCVLPLGLMPKSQMRKMGEEDSDMEKPVLEFINKHLTSPWCCLFR